MIRHCSLWRFQASLSASELDELAASFAAMARAVPGVRVVDVARNIGPSPRNFQLAANLDFDGIEGYLAYVADPSHVEFYHTALSPLGAERVAVQFPLGP